MACSEVVYCQIRKEWVAALPEEYVRQRFLEHMVTGCGFPASLIAVEKSLKHLPHLSVGNLRNIPRRRIDIMCFAKDPLSERGLSPLLVVECKAVKLTAGVIKQVVGYNHIVKADFVAIVNQEEIRTGWYDSAIGDYKFVNYLPLFDDLLRGNGSF